MKRRKMRRRKRSTDGEAAEDEEQERKKKEEYRFCSACILHLLYEMVLSRFNLTRSNR